jgi:hypothetical protein
MKTETPNIIKKIQALEAELRTCCDTRRVVIYREIAALEKEYKKGGKNGTT